MVCAAVCYFKGGECAVGKINGICIDKSVRRCLFYAVYALAVVAFQPFKKVFLGALMPVVQPDLIGGESVAAIFTVVTVAAVNAVFAVVAFQPFKKVFLGALVPVV